jgi:hypothetical protein
MSQHGYSVSTGGKEICNTSCAEWAKPVDWAFDAVLQILVTDPEAADGVMRIHGGADVALRRRPRIWQAEIEGRWVKVCDTDYAYQRALDTLKGWLEDERRTV